MSASPVRVVFTAMEEVVYGMPCAQAVADIAQRHGAKRVFVMASGTLNRETDEIARIVRALGGRAAGVFDRMPAHTPRASVLAATAAAREAQADLIVSVGGGSVTDAAKAVRLCLANGVRDDAQFDALAKGGAPSVVPQLAVPTTLSAGEFSSIAGVTNEATHAKELLRHPSLIPSAVVLDAAIARHTPSWLFLSTGVRALDHCIEGFCSTQAHAYAEAHCLHGLKLLAEGLVRVKEDPSDDEARLACLQGCWLSMGGVSTGVPMGASHGIGYVLGAAYGVPHGHTSCVMLPAVLRWNRPVTARRQAQLAAALGAPDAEASELVADLVARLGMPRSLQDVGVAREEIPRIAQLALKTPWVPHNPRPISGAADVEEILSLAA